MLGLTAYHIKKEVTYKMSYVKIPKNTNPITDHTIERLTIPTSDSLYKTALIQAPILANQLNPHAPNGDLRPMELRQTVAFSGYLAEQATIHFLNNYFQKLNNSNGNKIFARNVHTIIRNRQTFNQIDIEVVNPLNGKCKTIEVRSSNIFKGISRDGEVYNVDVSLIGKYRTANKNSELTKDYYITVLFRHSVDKIQSNMQNGYSIKLDIAAGASKDHLEQFGTLSNLNQNNALYKIINPITNAWSINDTAQDIYNSVL